MKHPLLGADVGTLRRALRDGGGADRRGAALALWASALARWPAGALERALLDLKLPRLEEIPPPVFILGHWRSGTTHLANLMSAAGFAYLPPLAAGMPWEMHGLARLLRPLLERTLPRRRYIDNMAVTPESPQEDEIALAAMTPLSFLHGVYFPRAFDRLIDRGVFFDGCSQVEIAEWRARFVYLLRKTAWGQEARLLVKNPVHTARPALLREMFPHAKFIHIHRDPVNVFLSMRNFYAKLLKRFALQTPPEELDIDATILRVHARMTARFEAETAGWGAPGFVEISYEALDREPLATLERVYATLGLDGFEAAAPRFRAHLASVQGFRKNAFRADPEAAAKVQAALGPWARRKGYAPEAARAAE